MTKFILQPITSELDVPTLVEIYFASFQDPLSLKGFPRTPIVRKWFENMIREEIKDPYAKHMKIVETTDENAESEGKIVAFAKWNLPKEVAPDAPPPQPEHIKWPEDETANTELVQRFFDLLVSKRTTIMGNGKDSKGFFYLEIIGTLPSHQGLGAGKLLMQWGCDAADAAGKQAYLEASPSGVKLYQKFGFQAADQAVLEIQGYGNYINLCMVREPLNP